MSLADRTRASSTTIQPLIEHARERLLSLDAYRGFVMLAMVSHGLALPHIARQPGYSGDPVWQHLAFQFDHVPWIGCSFWDLIQPSFMFMVGVAMAFSLASRAAGGQSWRQMALHAAWRSIALIFLGIFLRSVGRGQTNFTFVDVTTQIGLGYFFLFLVSGRRPIEQFTWALGILGLYWLAFYLYPVKDYDPSLVGAADVPQLTGEFTKHWNKNANLALDFDVWFLNLFPRDKPFAFDAGGYATLNFVPSLATMIFGLLAGELIRSGTSRGKNILWMVAAGAIGLAAGLALDYFEVCPLVKRIWTPSWTLFAAGCTLWMLAGFYTVIEVVRLRFWAFPLAVVGMNSIAIYCMDKLLRPFLLDSLKTHFGENLFSGKDIVVLLNRTFDLKLGSLRPEFVPLVENVVAILALWLICYWMYRRKIFIKL
jgi:predicted acyltransferase